MKLSHLSLMALAIFSLSFSACKKDGAAQEDPAKSVAQDTKWDYYLIGNWKYTESTPAGKKPTAYTKGVETFSGNDEYMKYHETAKQEKVILRGTWQLDDKEKYTVWVTQKSVQTGSGKMKEGNNRVKYVIQMLDTGKKLVYAVGDSYRTAEFLGQ